MKSNRFERAARPTRAKWVRPLFLLVLVAAAASPAMGQFTGGPSVRVIPNTKVEICWIAHFVGNGKVEIFELDFGTAAPLATALTSGSGNDHTVSFVIGGVLKADTTYYFKVTHSDPTGVRADTVSDRLQFFTGVQVVGGGFGGPVVEAGTDSAVITWGANVFGLGRVEYGTTTPGDAGTVDDEANAFGHSITLTGLLSNTTYRYRVSNRHAIDGGTLAEKTGSFSTPARCEDDQSQGAFNAGPSVRVSPNDSFEISWVEDFVGNGYVHIFDNPNSGTAIDGGLTESSPHTDHRIDFTIGGVLKADTTYYFKVRQEDPTGVRADTVSPCLPFFTGAQTIGDVFVDAGVDRARILWDANVIGIGHLDYGIASPDELSVEDQANVTSHSIELSGLTPGTTYQFRVGNRHAIDGGSLAAKTGSFTTLPSPPQVVQAIDDLRERVASYGLPRGIARSLDAKLEAALAAWQVGDSAGACGSLSAFLNEVRAQTGKKLTEAQAQQLTAAANDIRAQIGC